MNRSRCELFRFLSLFLLVGGNLLKSLFRDFRPSNPSRVLRWDLILSPKVPFLDSSLKSPPLSSFLLFKWESLLGNFPCSPFLNDDFASYVTHLAALAICYIVTSLGWAVWLLTLSWCMTLHVAISLLFLTESDKIHDFLSSISCSPNALLSGRDLSSSRARRSLSFYPHKYPGSGLPRLGEIFMTNNVGPT